jgi:hypothetical protein
MNAVNIEFDFFLGGGEVIIIKKNENFRLEGETMLY